MERIPKHRTVRNEIKDKTFEPRIYFGKKGKAKERPVDFPRKGRIVLLLVFFRKYAMINPLAMY